MRDCTRKRDSRGDFASRSLLFRACALCAAFTIGVNPAAAYDERVHQAITADALRDKPSLNAERKVPDAASLDRFRLHLYVVLAELPEFREKYPNPATFDRWAFKEFLGLNPEADIYGIDRLAVQTGSSLDLLVRSARHPDEDRRNQNRFAHDGSRTILRDSYGQPLPADPATLEMGAIEGLSSQAHAHYQLPQWVKSSDFEVLKSEPWRFGLPAEVHTFGLRFAQRFFLLSLLARTWKDPAAAYFADLFLGHAIHYAQDSTLPLHTLQVGLYDFFVDAKLGEFREDLFSMGGIFYRHPILRKIGTGIINNYHVFAEKLLAESLANVLPGNAAKAPLPPHAFGMLDAQTANLFLAATPSQKDWESTTTVLWPLVERSAREGAEIYRLAYKLGGRKLSKVDVEFGERDEAAQYLRHYPGSGADLERICKLQAEAAARAEAITQWLLDSRESAAAGADMREVERALAHDCLEMENEAATRRAFFVPSPPFAPVDYWFFSVELAVFLFLIYMIWWSLVRRRRGRPNQPTLLAA
jgi:hypothetical protein